MTNNNIDSFLPNAVSLGTFVNNSPEWHALRNEKGTISGSEIGAILGLSPFTSAVTVWAQKTGRLPSSFAPNTAMRLGQLVEPAIFTLFQEQHPELSVYEVGTYAHKEQTWGHANPDGVCVDASGNAFILEIKHTATYWDSVPEHYRAQVIWYMWVTGLKRAIFAVVNAGRYNEYEVLWDQFEFDAIYHRVLDFRTRIFADVQPDWDGSESTYETTRALSPGIESKDEELGTLGIELCNAQTDFDVAENHLREMKSRVIGALNGAKSGTVDGQVVATLSQRGTGAPYLTIKKAGKK
jgi:putative phage-type endonuclease